RAERLTGPVLPRLGVGHLQGQRERPDLVDPSTFARQRNFEPRPVAQAPGTVQAQAPAVLLDAVEPRGGIACCPVVRECGNKQNPRLLEVTPVPEPGDPERRSRAREEGVRQPDLRECPLGMTPEALGPVDSGEDAERLAEDGRSEVAA